MSELLDHILHDAQLHPDVALVNGISVLLTLLEVRKGRCVILLSLIIQASCFFCLRRRIVTWLLHMIFLLPFKSHLSLTNDLLFLPIVEREKNQ